MLSEVFFAFWKDFFKFFSFSAFFGVICNGSATLRLV